MISTAGCRRHRAFEVVRARGGVDDAHAGGGIAALHAAAVGALAHQAGGGDGPAAATAGTAAQSALDRDVATAAEAEAVVAAPQVVDPQGIGDGDAVVHLHSEISGAVTHPCSASRQRQAAAGTVADCQGSIEEGVAGQHQAVGRLQLQVSSGVDVTAISGIADHQITAARAKAQARTGALGPDLADLQVV